MPRKYFKYPAISLLVIFILISCATDEIPESKLEIRGNLIYEKGSEKPFTGREKARIENKIIEYDVVDGWRHGEFNLYFEDGTLAISGTLDSNRNVGRWQYFFESGRIESEGIFVYDSPEGKWLWYFPSGKLREEGFFNNGLKSGLWKQYNEQGKIVFEKKFDQIDSTSMNQDSIVNHFKKYKF